MLESSFIYKSAIDSFPIFFSESFLYKDIKLVFSGKIYDVLNFDSENFSNPFKSSFYISCKLAKS